MSSDIWLYTAYSYGQTYVRGATYIQEDGVESNKALIPFAGPLSRSFYTSQVYLSQFY